VEKFAVKEAPAFAVMGCDIAPLSLHDIHTYCVPAGPDCGEVVAMVCCETSRPVEDLSRGVSGAVHRERQPRRAGLHRHAPHRPKSRGLRNRSVHRDGAAGIRPGVGARTRAGPGREGETRIGGCR